MAAVATVRTGQTQAERGLASDILTLGGMSMLPGDETDEYVLSMSYTGKGRLPNGGFGIAAQDNHGNWVNAVTMNTGGTPDFVSGPWDSSYGLGTYGIDPATKTAWAVLNYEGNFAIDNVIFPGHWK